MTVIDTTSEIKKRRSAKLTKEEHKALKTLHSKFNTTVECAEFIGFHRNVLDRIIIVGSGIPENIEKIRKALERVNGIKTGD